MSLATLGAFGPINPLSFLGSQNTVANQQGGQSMFGRAMGLANQAVQDPMAMYAGMLGNQQAPKGQPVQDPMAQQQNQMDFMGLLSLILDAQQQQLGTKLDALQQPRSKIVHKDMSGNVIGPQNPQFRGLAKNFAMNPQANRNGANASKFQPGLATM